MCSGMEVTTSRYRDWIGGLFYIPYALGYTSLSAVAYFIRDWRVMHTAISIPVAFNLFFWWYGLFYLHNSPLEYRQVKLSFFHC